MENVIDTINNLIPCDDDTYIGDDGLLHCKKCGGYRQTKINVFGQEKIVRCVCPCIKDALEAENRRLEQQSIERYRNALRIKRCKNGHLKTICQMMKIRILR